MAHPRSSRAASSPDAASPSSGGASGGSRAEPTDPRDEAAPELGAFERIHRVPLTLACTECGARGYKTTALPGATLALKKYCRHCNRHTLHRETK
jgi:large subunit ribosomal protein L33